MPMTNTLIGLASNTGSSVTLFSNLTVSNPPTACGL